VDTDIQQHFGDTRKNISKLNGLLESLFFLSRIEEQQWCLVTKDLKVKEYMQQRLVAISESFADKNLDYSLHISEDLMYNVEKNTFSILIDNLISNAMKFSPINMKITIWADEKWFYVQDNWPGISPEDRNKIWDKFYRKDTNKEWFWVGLYLVKRITTLYWWDIQVADTWDIWTRFKVEIS